jgi:hypothetical protein
MLDLVPIVTTLRIGKIFGFAARRVNTNAAQRVQ